MVAEVLRRLDGGPGWYLDATLGDGGHAEALLERVDGARVLGTDGDPDSLVAARIRLARFGERLVIAQARFHEVPAAHARIGGSPCAGRCWTSDCRRVSSTRPDAG